LNRKRVIDLLQLAVASAASQRGIAYSAPNAVFFELRPRNSSGTEGVVQSSEIQQRVDEPTSKPAPLLEKDAER